MNGRQQRSTTAGIICKPQGIRNDAVEVINDVPYEMKYIIRIYMLKSVTLGHHFHT